MLKPLVLAGALLFASTAVAAQQSTVDEAIRQLKADDAFRAVLILNDVIAQNPADAKVLARAHALRAMAFLAQNQPERALDAVRRALQADRGFAPSAGELNASTIALFESARAPRAANAEPEAQRAEQAGNYQAAFLGYLAAYQALSSPPPVADDRRLRESIIRVVSKLPTAPVVPLAAREHVRSATQLIEAEAVLGNVGGASTNAAATELAQAIRLAPWWAEATLQYATVLQKLQRVDQALLNLNLYKLADPNAYAAATAKTNPAPVVAATRPAEGRAVPTGVGTIVVYRPRALNGASDRSHIECNGATLAHMRNGSTFTFSLPSGRQKVHVDTETFDLDVKPGERRYYRIKAGFSSWKIEPVSAREGEADIKERGIDPTKQEDVLLSQCPSVTPRLTQEVPSRAGAGEGRIVVYYPRPDRNWSWSDVRFAIRCDDAKIGDLKPHRALTVSAPAGEHVLKFNSWEQRIHVGPGQTAYYRLGGPSNVRRYPQPAEATAEIASLQILPSEAKDIDATRCSGGTSAR